ncbi:MAG TPA: hypothetical protein VFK81_01040 [Terriglobales bacterium]|nr:hypothetical protein [Terriglobales bacterium]
MTARDHIRVVGIVATLLCLFVPDQARAAGLISSSLLDNGYRDMYNLQFDEAHQAFAAWEQQHPEDPLGPASDAAAYLFDEFNRLHVLEFELFTDDHRLANQQKLAADPQVRRAFEAQLAKAEELADAALQRNPGDANALFAKALRLGLSGDYTALIDKRYLAGLGYMKQGRALAQQLLAKDPSYYDAYLAIGVENYLLSLKPAPIRWLLRLDGAETDRTVGVQKLQIVAQKGHYLLPYARLLLAVAALRDNNREQARALLEGLAQEFPRNHLYAEELAQLEKPQH